ASTDYFFDIKPGHSGTYVMAGTATDSGAQDADAWIVKADSSFTSFQQMELGGTGSEIAFGVAVPANASGYVLAGVTASFGVGAGDVWALRTDENLGLTFNAAANGHVRATTDTRVGSKDSSTGCFQITAQTATQSTPSFTVTNADPIVMQQAP